MPTSLEMRVVDEFVKTKAHQMTDQNSLTFNYSTSNNKYSEPPPTTTPAEEETSEGSATANNNSNQEGGQGNQPQQARPSQAFPTPFKPAQGTRVVG